MRKVGAAIVLVAAAAAGEDEVTVEARGRPPIEGTLLASSPLNVETRYGTLSIPLSDLLSLDPKEGVALAHEGAVHGRFDWADLTIRTKYGEARLPLADAARVTWKRPRRVPKAAHHFEFADGTSLSGATALGQVDFATAYGMLTIPLAEVRLLRARREAPKDFELRLAGMTLSGEPRVETFTLDTAYGVLRVPKGDLVRLSRRTLPSEGDRIEGGYVVGVVGAHGGSFYALVTSDAQMTWRQAKEIAERMDGHLATIGDALENGFLCALLKERRNVQPWIGFSDEEREGDWRWITGEPVRFTNWGPGEPNDAGRREDHGEFLGGSNGLWNDVEGATGRFGCIVEIE